MALKRKLGSRASLYECTRCSRAPQTYAVAENRAVTFFCEVHEKSSYLDHTRWYMDEDGTIKENK